MTRNIQREQMRQRRTNGNTLKTLAANGSLLHRPHAIVNVFHAFDDDALNCIRVRLRERGFALSDQGSRQTDHGQDYWLVETLTTVVPTREAIDSLTDSCVEVASDLSAEYDGWYTEVVES